MPLDHVLGLRTRRALQRKRRVDGQGPAAAVGRLTPAATAASIVVVAACGDAEGHYSRQAAPGCQSTKIQVTPPQRVDLDQSGRVYSPRRIRRNRSPVSRALARDVAVAGPLVAAFPGRNGANTWAAAAMSIISMLTSSASNGLMPSESRTIQTAAAAMPVRRSPMRSRMLAQRVRRTAPPARAPRRPAPPTPRRRGPGASRRSRRRRPRRRPARPPPACRCRSRRDRDVRARLRARQDRRAGRSRARPRSPVVPVTETV